jgi:hypothetical protein
MVEQCHKASQELKIQVNSLIRLQETSESDAQTFGWVVLAERARLCCGN